MNPQLHDLVFYDGACGMCHWLVKFVLPRDPAGQFRFAPIGGEAFLKRIPEQDRAHLPDSVMVLTADDRLLVRSAASLYILRRLGGVYGIMAGITRLCPRVVCDCIYDLIARYRKKFFAPPKQACPVVPTELRSRFER